jgi:uncharacterized membrane protein
MWKPTLIFKILARNIIEREKTSVYLLIIIFWGLILRIYNLGKFGFWYDEAINLFYTSYQLDLETITKTVLTSRQPIALFFVTAIKIWNSLVYPNEFFLRLFSVIWGVFSIILIYRLGALLFSKKIGIASALLLSISPLHVYYSQELTYYSLSMFLALCSSYYFLKILKNSNSTSLIIYVLTTIGLIHTHFINITLILVQFLFFYLFYRKNKDLEKKWIFLNLVVFFICLPWIGILILQILRSYKLDVFFWIRSPDFKMLTQTFMVFSLGYHVSWQLQLVMLIIFLYFLLKALYIWREESGVFYLIFWLFIPICLFWLISQWHPFYLHRFFIFVLPAFYLLIAAGLLANGGYAVVKGTMIILFLILSFCALKNAYEDKLPLDFQKRYIAVWPKKEYREASLYVSKNFREGDIILHISRSTIAPFIYYHQRRFPEAGIILNNICHEDWLRMGQKTKKQYFNNSTDGKGPLNIYVQIDKKEDLHDFKRIWLVSGLWESEGKTYLINNKINNRLIEWFKKNFTSRNIQIFSGINIYLFS